MRIFEQEFCQKLKLNRLAEDKKIRTAATQSSMFRAANEKDKFYKTGT